MKRAVVLARGQFRTSRAKTAHGLILQGRRYRVVAVIDESCAGRDAGEVMGLGRMGIPVFKELSGVPGVPPLLTRSQPRPGKCAELRSPERWTLIIGIAPTGGRLPRAWKRDIREAIRRGMDVVSGLHDFLSDDDELSRLARECGVEIWDVRRPPEGLDVARGCRSPVPVVLVCGTDCAVGKRTVTAELHRGARRRGIDAALVATGQTGMLVGCDAGAVVDHIPGDFMSGAVEAMVRRVVARGKELVFVQGQASLTHLAYGPVTLGILYGSRPHYTVVVHEPGRRFRPSFPDQRVPGPMEEARLARELSGAEPVGISLNCSRLARRRPAPSREPPHRALCRRYERATGLPTVDVLLDGPDRILDSLLMRLAKRGDLEIRPGLRRALERLEEVVP
ncbi:MAG: DUF1611 domain-containing protein [Thermoplasmatota archaeon]